MGQRRRERRGMEGGGSKPRHSETPRKLVNDEDKKRKHGGDEREAQGFYVLF